MNRKNHKCLAATLLVMDSFLGASISVVCALKKPTPSPSEENLWLWDNGDSMMWDNNSIILYE